MNRSVISTRFFYQSDVVNIFKLTATIFSFVITICDPHHLSYIFPLLTHILDFLFCHTCILYILVRDRTKFFTCKIIIETKTNKKFIYHFGVYFNDIFSEARNNMYIIRCSKERVWWYDQYSLRTREHVRLYGNMQLGNK